MGRRAGYDWLDDPFDEKKSAQLGGGMSGGSKAAVGIGCAVAVAVLLVLFAMLLGSIGNLLTSLS